MKCPYDGSTMIEHGFGCYSTREPQINCDCEWAGWYCPSCPHIQFHPDISEEDRGLWELGCSCGPCRQAGKKRGLRY